MRREAQFRMPRSEALALLARVPVVHLATTTPDGAPVLRTLHAAIVDGALVFHAAPIGEKMETLGRACVICAEELVASIPSYFLDAERACPATTLYRSVQVHGTLEPVDDMDAKARALAAILAKHQPEGGHAPMRADDSLYTKAVAGIAVVRISLEQLDGKAKLGQHRSPADRAAMLEGLWKRGARGDVEAIELIRAVAPDSPAPALLRGPEGLTLHAALDASAVTDVLRLVHDDAVYWNDLHTDAELARAHLGASAWVGARDADGKLVATARALSDGGKCAWLYDVIVAPEWRGRGVGAALVQLLLAHPAVRNARSVRLGTRTAQDFYARFGFTGGAPTLSSDGKALTTMMTLWREPSPALHAPR